MSRRSSPSRLTSFTSAPAIPLFEGLLAVTAAVVLFLGLTRTGDEAIPSENAWPEAAASPSATTTAPAPAPLPRAIAVVGSPEPPQPEPQRRTDREPVRGEFSSPVMPEVVAPPDR